MEDQADQLLGVVIAGVALVGILVKIIWDEVLRRHNPNLETIDLKLDGLKDELREIRDTLKEIRDAVRRDP